MIQSGIRDPDGSSENEKTLAELVEHLYEKV